MIRSLLPWLCAVAAIAAAAVAFADSPSPKAPPPAIVHAAPRPLVWDGYQETLEEFLRADLHRPYPGGVMSPKYTCFQYGTRSYRWMVIACYIRPVRM